MSNPYMILMSMAMAPWKAVMEGGQSMFALAPQALNQPILPGWNLGTNNHSVVNITENNSHAPDTEMAILEKKSYGTQIGHLLDAMQRMIVERPEDAPDHEAFTKVLELHADVQRIKCEQAYRRLQGAASDLETLKRENPGQYRELVESLEAVIRQQHR